MYIRRRGFMLIVTVVLVISLGLAGCSSSDSTKEPEVDKDNLNDKGFPIVKDKVDLTFVAPSSTTKDWNDVLVFNKYKDMTNMNIKWKMVSEDGLDEKRNLMLNTGDYPDALHSTKLSDQDVANYGEQGIFIPLEKLIDKYAPNFKKILDENPAVKKGLTMPDGHIYSFPRVFDPEFASVLSGWKTWINKDYLDALNMKNPETIDDFYDYLKAVKEDDPNGNGKQDEVPLHAVGDDKLIYNFEGSFGIRNRGFQHTLIDKDPDKDELRFIPTSDGYKQMLQFFSKLYKEGLLNHDIYTVESEQAFAVGKKGLFGSTVTTNPESAYEQDNYIGANVMRGPNGDDIYANVKSPLVDIGAFVITDKNPNPGATVRWIDYFYGEEGMKLFFMGEKDKTYKEKSNGELEYTDLIENNPDGLERNKAISKYMVWRSGSYPSMVTKKYFNGSEALPTSIKAAKKIEGHEPEEIWAPFNYTSDENEILSSIGSDIKNYDEESRAQFITGKKSFDEWDDYVKTFEKQGLDKYMKVQNDAYKRYKEQD